MKWTWTVIAMMLMEAAIAAPKSTIKSITELANGTAYKVVFANTSADKDDVEAAKETVIVRWKAKHNADYEKIETRVPIGVSEPTVVFIFYKKAIPGV